MWYMEKIHGEKNRANVCSDIFSCEVLLSSKSSFKRQHSVAWVLSKRGHGWLQLWSRFPPEWKLVQKNFILRFWFVFSRGIVICRFGARTLEACAVKLDILYEIESLRILIKRDIVVTFEVERSVKFRGNREGLPPLDVRRPQTERRRRSARDVKANEWIRIDMDKRAVAWVSMGTKRVAEIPLCHLVQIQSRHCELNLYCNSTTPCAIWIATRNKKLLRIAYLKWTATNHSVNDVIKCRKLLINM